jgi:hypothetical protein
MAIIDDSWIVALYGSQLLLRFRRGIELLTKSMELNDTESYRELKEELLKIREQIIELSNVTEYYEQTSGFVEFIE